MATNKKMVSAYMRKLLERDAERHETDMLGLHDEHIEYFLEILAKHEDSDKTEVL